MRYDTSWGVIPLKKLHGKWQVLLVQLHKGHWGFPKGHSENEESGLEAAKRELKEETGLEIETLLFEEPLCEHYFFRDKDDLINKTVKYFIATVKGTVVLQQLEIAASKWVPFEDVESYLTFPELKKLSASAIAKVLNGSDGP